MFLHRRPLARFRRQEAEPAISLQPYNPEDYLQLYIPEDWGELAASEMPQLGSTQGLLDMMGGGSSAEEEGGPPRKQRRLEETAPGARPAPPEEVAEEIAPTEVDPSHFGSNSVRGQWSLTEQPHWQPGGRGRCSALLESKGSRESLARCVSSTGPQDHPCMWV